MSHKGIRVSGEKCFLKKKKLLKYHWADRGGRMYLCDCYPAFRIGDRIKYPDTIRSSKMTMVQRYRFIWYSRKK